MKATTTRGKGGTGKDAPPRPGSPIQDGSGDWSAGLRHDGQAALVGTILAAMSHVDELMADLAADRLAPDARTVLAALDEDDAARLALLRSLPGADEALMAAAADYAAARRLWRAYGRGLWYTHQSGRTYLAAPDPDGSAAFRVAREVKPADLRRAREQVDRLAETLAGLARPSRMPTVPRKPPLSRKPPSPTSPAEAPPPTEAIRAKRLAPTRTAGARRRAAPVRPAKATPRGNAPAPEGTETVPPETDRVES